MLKLDKCPCCSSTKLENYITCKDYTVSGENFSVVSCSNCFLKFTNPRPEDEVIGKYYKSEEYISHSNTNKGIVSKLYHLVRGYTLKKKISLIESYVSRGTLLDYGAGTGMFLTAAEKAGWKVYGVEPDNGARLIANKTDEKVFSDKITLVGRGVDKVNVITLWHVLEHVTDLKETLTLFKSLLDKQGVLVIAVPNYTSNDAQYYKEHWAAYDVPRHLYHFEINSIQKLLSPYGFSLLKTHPMKFDSFYVSMLSEKYKTGSVNYLRALYRGLVSNLKARSAKDYSSVVYVFKPV